VGDAALVVELTSGVTAVPPRVAAHLRLERRVAPDGREASVERADAPVGAEPVCLAERVDVSVVGTVGRGHAPLDALRRREVVMSGGRRVGRCDQSGGGDDDGEESHVMLLVTPPR
jgi:hypothetical protein